MIAITIAVPSFAAHAVYLAAFFSGGWFIWMAARIKTDRQWEAQIRRGAAWQLASPHLAPGEPWIAPSRPGPSSGLYNTRPFRGPYVTQQDRLAA